MFKTLWCHLLASLLLSLLAVVPAPAQPVLTDSGFTENFDSMGQDGAFPPDGWAVYTIPGSNSVWQTSIPADAVAFGSPSSFLLTVQYPRDPAATNNRGYNAGTDDAPDDRTLATSPTGVDGAVLELTLMNGTCRDLTSLTISYDIRRLTVGAGTNDTGNGPGADELPGYWLFYSLDGGFTYTNVSDLNPDINSVPNTVGVTHIPADLNGAASYVLNLSCTPLTAGSTIIFRWVDDNGIASSPDQIIGLDNVSITTTPPCP